MVKEFTYISHNETKNRKVFVIKENDHYIAGIDLNLISKEDADFIVNHYKDVVPINDFKSKVELENFNPAWNKAYRQFSKNKID